MAKAPVGRKNNPLPTLAKIDGVGLGLRRHYIHDIAETLPTSIDWFEIAPENYIGRGGKVRDSFEKIAGHYPIIAHGLSLSIGSLDALDWNYLKQLKQFLRRYRIPWFSDHLCFSSRYNHFFHDLLPLPFTEEAVAHVSERARIVQDFLEVPFALENISFYVYPNGPDTPEMTETEFIQEILHRSGVHLMLDINNVFVNAFNHRLDAQQSLMAFKDAPILQLHIAGHDYDDATLIIDTHGQAVRDEVWALLAFFRKARGTLPPLLIERDNHFPPLAELIGEIERAKHEIT